MNRAFYGIMNSRALMAPDGTYTNEVLNMFEESEHNGSK